MRKIDLTGQTYGFLQVKEKDADRKGYWICQCTLCGNYKSIAGRHLRSGATVSCGCYGDKRRKENLRKYNEYDLSGEYGIGKIDNSDITFLFDKEDYDKIKDIRWRVQSAGYIYGVLDGKDISFHRYVMNAKEGEVVDHINHKVRDNRKSNLRICTQNDNVINKNSFQLSEYAKLKVVDGLLKSQRIKNIIGLVLMIQKKKQLKQERKERKNILVNMLIKKKDKL